MTPIKNIPASLNKPRLAQHLLHICQKNRITFLGMFGSFAKGEDTLKSDLDMLITFDDAKGKSLFDLVKLENELSELFKRKVDLLTVRGLSPYLKDEILASILPMYEAR